MIFNATTKNIQLTLATITAVMTVLVPTRTSADPMAFGLKPEGHVYSTEKANGAFYGDTMGGLMAESSVLRLEAEKDLQKGDLDEAIRKARKAVQYDIESTESHLILARAMTARLYQSDFNLPPNFYKECLHEWRLLRWHNPDSSEQAEAARELLKLKINKVTVAHRHKEREEKVQAIVLKQTKAKSQPEPERDLDSESD